MALFDIRKTLDSNLIVADNHQEIVVGDPQMFFRQKALDVIGDLQDLRPRFFFSDNDFSLHELIAALLHKVGPSELGIITWSITIDPISVIGKLKADGLITKLSGLIDARTQRNHPQAFQMVLELFDELRIISSHAKVTLISNDHFKITIIGSANLTINPRLEVGQIFFDPDVFNFYSGVLNRKLHESD